MNTFCKNGSTAKLATGNAAERVTGIKLRTVGKLGDLRARVRVVGDLSNEMAFYASPQ
jgi:hypothetical protein